MSTQANVLHAVAIDSPAADVVLIEEALAAADLVASSYSSRETGRALTYVMAEDEADAKAKLLQVTACLEPWGDLLSQPPAIDLRAIQKEDWSESWKAAFKPFRLGEHMLIRPSWESVVPRDGDHVIEIDPGMAFGTGTHETTGMCVKLVEKYVRPGDFVIDIGTGTGILAIAAAHMGARPVLATDLDAVAVRVAAETVRINASVNVRTREGVTDENIYDSALREVLDEKD